jgi:hypothetical protein
MLGPSASVVETGQQGVFQYVAKVSEQAGQPIIEHHELAN